MHHVEIIARHLAQAAGAEAVQALGGSFAETNAELISPVLDSAARYADAHLVPLNKVGDRNGCTLVDGRVRTPEGHSTAWAAFREGGWLALDAPEYLGGAGLTNALAIAVQELFDQACPAFGMMPVPQRAGARLLHAYGDEATKAEWLPKMMSGEWGSTICISEPDAGSDVRRIRTRGTHTGDGNWRISGEKCWISFGDQDLTDRIGHFLLAQTESGISLFLVPDWTGSPSNRNAIVVRRIEEKMGLHLSPTCALGFEDAHATLIGEAGRGLPQLFVMIANMRLATGVQGAGIAAAAYATAAGYAQERRQGGSGAQPVPIAEHADIQMTLLEMAARLETLRGLNFAVANHADLARSSSDDVQRKLAATLNGWLLPIVKTLGGDAAFANAGDAIQILGGAGYTREWPVEQALRDARVLTIFEGTTGMQAQDLLFRRVLKDRSSYQAFLDAAAPEAQHCASFSAALSTLEAIVTALCDPTLSQRDLETAATPFLQLATLVSQGWAAANLSRCDGDDPPSRHLRAASNYFLCRLAARAETAARQVVPNATLLSAFGDLA
jgi:3-(methylthio)propanoyl-CoA dehydrogenase